MTENEKNYFFWNKKAFEEAIKGVVCPHCEYDSFQCKNPDPRGCALFRYLPDLVRVAQQMKDGDLESYTRAVEQNIPFHCEHVETPGNPCRLLDSLHCGLDKLLPFVLEAVKKTDEKLV